MSLFLSFVVGSLGMVLYVLVSLSKAVALSCVLLFIHDDHGHPMSAVNTNLDWSSLSSLMALNSSLVMFGLVGGPCA